MMIHSFIGWYWTINRAQEDAFTQVYWFLLFAYIRENVYDFNYMEQSSCDRFLKGRYECKPMPVGVRSQGWICGRSLAGIAGSNPVGGMDDYLL